MQALRPATFLKKDSNRGVFLCILAIFIYFEKHLQMAASDYSFTIVMYLFSAVSTIMKKTMTFHGDH